MPTASGYISGHQAKVNAKRSLAGIARKSGNTKEEAYFSAEADRLNPKQEWANDKKLQAWTDFIFAYFRDPQYCPDLQHGKCSIQPRSSLFTDFSEYLQTIQMKTTPPEEKFTEIVTGLETLAEGLSQITWIASERP